MASQTKSKSVVRTVARKSTPVVRTVEKADVSLGNTLPDKCTQFYNDWCNKQWTSLPTTLQLKETFEVCCKADHAATLCTSVATETFNMGDGAMTDESCDELVKLGQAHDDWKAASGGQTSRSSLQERQSLNGDAQSHDLALVKKGPTRRRRDRRRRDRRRRDRRRRDRRRRDLRRRDCRRRTPSPTAAPTNPPNGYTHRNCASS